MMTSQDQTPLDGEQDQTPLDGEQDQTPLDGEQDQTPLDDVTRLTLKKLQIFNSI